MVTVQAHKFQTLRCMKAGPAFRQSQAEFFNKKKTLVLFKQVSMSTDEMNHPLGDTALIANLQFMTRSLYIQNEG